MKKISNGNNNNEISINKIVNGPKEVMEAGDAVNAFIDVNQTIWQIVKLLVFPSIWSHVHFCREDIA